MSFSEKDLYVPIENVSSKTSQDFGLTGQGPNSKNLKTILKEGFVKEKNKFEEAWKKSYLAFHPKRALKKIKKEKKPRGLTSKERKELKVFDIPKEQQRYEVVLPLHELWCGYMEKTFRLSSLQASQISLTQEDLTKADYHGAVLRVIEALNPTLVGIEGIVVRETKNMFHIITQQNSLKILPKSVCTFVCQMKNVQIKIFGKNFCARPADRIKKRLGKKQPITVL